MFIDYGACAVDNREQILCDVLKFDYHSISGKHRIILSHRKSTPFIIVWWMEKATMQSLFFKANQKLYYSNQRLLTKT